MVDLLGRLKGLIASEAEHLTYIKIAPSQVKPAEDDKAFEVGTSYVELRLVEMFLKHDRELWKGRYPMVHSMVRTLYDGQKREIPYVAGPDQLGGPMDNQRLNKVINLNHRLAGPIPYSGDDLEVAVALFSVEDVDWAGATLKLISGVAEAVSLAPLKSALPVVEEIKSGLEGLIGLNDVSLKLGLRDAFSSPQTKKPNTLIQGYLIAVNAPDQQRLRDTLRVVDGHLRSGSTEPYAPFEEYDYFLLRIDRLDTREDFEQFPFHQLWVRLVDHLFEATAQQVKDALTAIAQAIFVSPDLTRVQKVQLVRVYKKRTDELLKMKPKAAAKRPPKRRKVTPRPTIDISQEVVSPEEAMKLRLTPLSEAGASEMILPMPNQ